MKGASKLNAAILAAILAVGLILIDIRLYTTTGRSRLAEASSAITSVVRFHRIVPKSKVSEKPQNKEMKVSKEIEDLHSQVQNLIKKIDEHEIKYHMNDYEKVILSKKPSPKVKDVGFTGDVETAISKALEGTFSDLIKKNGISDGIVASKTTKPVDPIIEIRKFDDYNAFVDYGKKKMEKRDSEINDADAKEIKHVRLSEVNDILKENNNKSEVEKQMALQEIINSAPAKPVLKLVPVKTPNVALINKRTEKIELEVKPKSKTTDEITRKEESLIRAAKKLAKKIDNAASKIEIATKKLDEKSEQAEMRNLDKEAVFAEMGSEDVNQERPETRNVDKKLDRLDKKQSVEFSNPLPEITPPKEKSTKNSKPTDDLKPSDDFKVVNSELNPLENSKSPSVIDNNTKAIKESINKPQETSLIGPDGRSIDNPLEGKLKDLPKIDLNGSSNESFKDSSNKSLKDSINDSIKDSIKDSLKESMKPALPIPELDSSFIKNSTKKPSSDNISSNSFADEIFKGMDFSETPGPESLSKVDTLNDEIKNLKASKKLLKEIEAANIKDVVEKEMHSEKTDE